MIKAVVFDIDNTLTNDVSWLRITELLGASVERHQEIFAKFLANELTYPDAKAQLIRLWQSTGKTDKEYWRAMLEDWPLKPDADALVGYAQDSGLATGLISGSVDLFTESVARKLGVADWYANTTLIWDESGQLVDFDYVRDQSAQKLQNLMSFCEKHDLIATECIAVGDGENEIGIFQATDHGILLGDGSEKLREIAWQQAHDLGEVIRILKTHVS